MQGIIKNSNFTRIYLLRFQDIGGDMK